MWLFTNPFDPFHIKMFNFKAKNQILIMTFRNKLLQQWKLSLGQFQGWDPHFWELGWQPCGNNPGNVKFVTKAPYIDWIKLGKPIKDKTFLNLLIVHNHFSWTLLSKGKRCMRLSLCKAPNQEEQHKGLPGGGVLPYMGHIGMCRCEDRKSGV